VIKSIIVPLFVLFGLWTTSRFCHYYLQRVQKTTAHLSFIQSTTRKHNHRCSTKFREFL